MTHIWLGERANIDAEWTMKGYEYLALINQIAPSITTPLAPQKGAIAARIAAVASATTVFGSDLNALAAGPI
tara:strand:+ start:308 stop:523 length:216 start_codon:yes stop_codon:yes gene_type:complete